MLRNVCIFVVGIFYKYKQGVQQEHKKTIKWLIDLCKMFKELGSLPLFNNACVIYKIMQIFSH